MTSPEPLIALRSIGWSGVPQSAGVYWWFFPQHHLDSLGIRGACDVSRLRLRRAADGRVCLYHGLATNLAQRVAWHANQKLTPGSLKSGFLSTLRLSLLALNDYDYRTGEAEINAFFDTLAIAWRTTETRDLARSAERAELQGDFHYPLNIQGNRRPEVASFVQHLKALRKAYKLRQLANLDVSS